MKRVEPRLPRCCGVCGAPVDARALMASGSVICDDCTERTRVGRDNTSRALKSQQAVDRLRVDQLQGKPSHMASEDQEYASVAGQLMAQVLHEPAPAWPDGSGGEVVDPKLGGVVNTLTSPTVTALEASAHRTDLLTMVGNDVAAMALDAADTIQAGNSVEKMLAHQMAAIHNAAMRMLHRANLTDDPALAVKTMNAAMKGFATFLGGINALRQMRGNQQQHIVVQHVNVSAGGQAVVGSVNTRGGQSE